MSEFYRAKRMLLGVKSWCKTCDLAWQKKLREENPEYFKSASKKQRQRLKVKRASWSEEQWSVFRQQENSYHRKWTSDNSETNRPKVRARERKRYKTDVNARLRHILRTRFKRAMKRNSTRGSVINKIGCTVPELRKYLESQFLPGMSWENHGKGRDKWNIDHFIPLASFDLTNPQHSVLAFHYLNLRPLWEFDNLSKGAKYPVQLMELEYA